MNPGPKNPSAVGKIGVLLLNLGTPDAPDPKAVRRYLKEFLSDSRVVEIPALLWKPILYGAILPFRPRKSAHAYAQVWGEKGSPLAVITAEQSAALQGCFGPDVIIDYAMRYGNPSISSKLDSLRAKGCERILIAPLYPQYCGATTATANDKVFAALAAMRWQPAIRTLPPYYDDPAYINALAQSAAQGLAKLDFQPDAILTSFHGMPERTRDLGDPYYRHCLETARLLGEAMGREPILAFQSRFGRAKWLEPATDVVLAGLPEKGIRKIAVLAPGFAADCVETLEEIALQGRETFIAAGGTEFAYLPCLNASPEAVTMMRQLLARELAGWINAA